MNRRIMGGILVAVIAVVALGILVLLAVLPGHTTGTDAELTATAAMVSPSGDPMGNVAFRQHGDSVLVAVDVHGLTPGGHALAIHSIGSCTPDFQAAGDHFNAAEARRGFIHRNWKREVPYGDHGGDLPNIYAHADGSARADFATDGFTIRLGKKHSLLDEDGASVVIYQEPQRYGEPETADGDRIACGVIQLN